ncbi:MAG: hypothetical protein IPL83_19565 [Bdellovibrionales bacterium]|nr:hypothetical protein [Bdellovibrionales bacterium]
MARLKKSAFILIMLVGVSIGANNMTRYERGQKPLADRSEYCEWISLPERSNSESPKYVALTSERVFYPSLAEETYDHLWSLSQKLKAYRSRQVKFDYLPRPVLNVVQEIHAQKTARLNQVNKLLEFVTSEKSNIKNSLRRDDRERDYQIWKLGHELPDQIARLEAERIGLETLLQNFNHLRFNDEEAFQLFLQTYSADPEALESGTPYLAIEINLKRGFFSQQLDVYPIWIEGQKRTRASTEPYFSLSQSMVPEDFAHSLVAGKLPAIYQSYIHLIEQASTTSSPTSPTLLRQPSSLRGDPIARFEILDKNRLIIKGTPYSNRLSLTGDPKREWLNRRFTSASNFAIDGVLDLGCIQNSRWAKRLVNETDQLLNNPQLASDYKFEKVDERNLRALAILKSLNSQQDWRLSKNLTPFWESFFH